MNTKHARTRAQQRCIPPLIQQWLEVYGEAEYDGHGGIIRYFSRSSIKSMKRDFGSAPIKKMTQYLVAYKVESSHDGKVLTIGHRSKRIKRK